MRIMLIILLAVLLIANVWATLVALRSDTVTPTQKGLHSFFVWLVPFLGAFVVVMFHRLDRRSQGPQPEPARLDGSEIDVGLAMRHDGRN